MIDELLKLLPPPNYNKFLNEIQWTQFEIEINTRLPEDFKNFISIYGSGIIDNFIWILNPFSKNKNLNYEKIVYFQKSYHTLQKEFPKEYNRPLFPQKGSFLPWAVTDNGETFFWVVNDDPNSWIVGIHSVDQGDEEIYELGCVEFLLGLLRRDFVSKILPIQFPPSNLEKHVFKSFD